VRARALPSALLLDLGGVLADTRDRHEGLAPLFDEIQGLVRRSSGTVLGAQRIRADVDAGLRAYSQWKAAEGRRPRPREISYRELWAELIAADWPPPARSAVIAHASALCHLLDQCGKERRPMDGAQELLQTVTGLGVRTGIVSNSLAASGSRDFVRRAGLEPYIGVQVYSDEVGLRKPNPAIFRLVAEALDVDLAACWYVGDTWDRDVVGGRRAGVGRVILLEGSRTTDGDAATVAPDHRITHLREILALLPLPETA
jgi:FMN phosphatase YigB (HAD superfamily)